MILSIDEINGLDKGCAMKGDDQCEEFNEKGYRETRRELTFPIYANETDAKNYTIKVSSAFLDNYLPGLIANLTCDVVDLGVGNGDFSYKVADYMHGKCNSTIIYEGIDNITNFVFETKSKLSTLSFVNNKIIQGNCFGKEIDDLVSQPVLLIAAHVIYYLGNLTINDFIENILKKMGLVAIIIAQADGSIMNNFAAVYSHSNKKKSTEIPVGQALETHNISFSHIKILYNSLIYFPPKIPYTKLMELAKADFMSLTDEDYKIRGLLEFVAGAPLEYLSCLDKKKNGNKLDHFIGDIHTNLRLNDDAIKVWSYMSITVPKDKMNQEDMQLEWRKIQNLMLSGNETAFGAAIKEGNYEIALELYRQGIVTCELRNYSYNSLKEISNMAKSYIRYELRLSTGWPEFLKYFFNFDLDERINFRNYTSPEILKMSSTKYNYELEYNLPNNAREANNLVEFKGSPFRESFKNTKKMNSLFSSIISYPILYEFGCSYILYKIFMLFPNKLTKYELSLALIMIYNSFWKKFFYTSSSAIHYIEGDDFLFQLYLFDTKNYDSLRFQNSEGQTALHKAILAKDRKKIYNLLSCSDSIVETITNIADERGSLPLHDAVIHDSDYEIIQMLIEKAKDINIKVKASFCRIFFDLLFVGGKTFYLYTYFTGWMNAKETGLFQKNYIAKTLQFTTLVGLYTFLNRYDMKFPDKIYYLAFLHRLNSYDDWENTNKFNHAYNRYSYDTALHLSVKSDRVEISKYLIARNDTEINSLNIKGESALHIAAAKNNIELIDLLIEHDVNVNIQASYKQYNPIGYAIDNWILYPIGSLIWSLSDVGSWTNKNFLLPIVTIINNNIIPSVKQIIEVKDGIFNSIKSWINNYPLCLLEKIENEYIPLIINWTKYFVLDSRLSKIELPPVINDSIQSAYKFVDTWIYTSISGLINILLQVSEEILLRVIESSTINIIFQCFIFPIKVLAINLFLFIEWIDKRILQPVVDEISGWSIYPIGDLLIKSLTLYYGANNILKAISEVIFLKIIRDEIFSSFSSINSATPLHYAAGGMNLLNLRLGENIIKSSNVENKAIIKLIENGADPDLTMGYYSSPDLQLIPYIVAKSLIIISSAILRKEVPAIYTLPTLLISQSMFSLWNTQSFFSYNTEELKPIALINNTSENGTCTNEENKYLKQYTVLNQYNDVGEVGYLDLKYYLYKLNILSDKDIIYMHEYGIYKGGSGKDIFHVYYNSLDQDAGYKLIIKDYNIAEDIIVIHNYKKEQIGYKHDIIMNKDAITLYLNNDNSSLVTLLGANAECIEKLTFSDNPQ